MLRNPVSHCCNQLEGRSKKIVRDEVVLNTRGKSRDGNLVLKYFLEAFQEMKPELRRSPLCRYFKRNALSSSSQRSPQRPVLRCSRHVAEACRFERSKLPRTKLESSHPQLSRRVASQPLLDPKDKCGVISHHSHLSFRANFMRTLMCPGIGKNMPERKTIERARKDKREGKAASTQAGEFIREEMDHIRKGIHGARSTKQAIAIGLSKARRAGVDLPPPKRGTTSEKTRKSARRAYLAGRKSRSKPASNRRSRATLRALRREGTRAASHAAISHQVRLSSRRRSVAQRRASARQAATTRSQRRHSRRS